MYAIIKLKDGSNYGSVVFGMYKEQQDNFCYEYFIVFNKEKTSLIKKYMFSKSSKYLNPEVLITDTATDGWTMEQERTGQISFFDASLPQKVETNTVEEDLLLKCKALDSEYVYKGLKEIKTQKDIEDLEEVSGGFHDAYIAKLEKDENKNLHVLFKGVWGCSIEFIFSDYVTYHVYVDDLYNDYWFESCMCFDSRGFFCLNDEEYPLDEKEKPERDMYHTWFKANKAEYRVIL